ncbi:SET domain-containing protein [Limnohabitans sp. Rim8]|uniref:SET domain-containing protein n=1 Tax=Limnohabitans sp. Rim8 TaxID=1100718 RepID=UPI0033057BD8
MSKIKKNLLKHLQEEVYCKLGISKIHGIGVFAIRAIPKGANPMRTWHKVEEVPISLKDLQGLPESVRQELDLFCYHNQKVMHIPSVGMNTMNMAVYLNHSKKPSVSYQKNGQLKTLRAIRTGEELLLDYDVSFGEIHLFE